MTKKIFQKDLQRKFIEQRKDTYRQLQKIGKVKWGEEEIKGNELRKRVEKLFVGGRTPESVEKELKEKYDIGGKYIDKRKKIMKLIGGDEPLVKPAIQRALDNGGYAGPEHQSQSAVAIEIVKKMRTANEDPKVTKRLEANEARLADQNYSTISIADVNQKRSLGAGEALKSKKAVSIGRNTINDPLAGKFAGTTPGGMGNFRNSLSGLSGGLRK
ncbi:MAG: hypothetical protein Q8Q23_02185 [bacterium]|nr:hypothetical protein [bacterium]